jgi:hypothetical protein
VLEQGELLAEFVYFVLRNVVIVCLSFHNCMLFILITGVVPEPTFIVSISFFSVVP